MSQTDKYEKQIENFYNEIHLANYPHDDATMEELDITEKRCKLLSKCLNWLFIIGLVFYNSLPILSNWWSGAFHDRSIALETTQYILLPFSYKYDLSNWIFASLIFSYNTFTFSYLIVYLNILMISILIHLVAHVRIMKKDLEDLSKYVGDDKFVLSLEEDREVTFKLRKFLDQHLLLLRSLESFKEFFGLAILAAFVYDAVALCVIFLLLFKDPSSFFRYGGLGVAVVLQLYGQSYAMEELSNSVENLRITLFQVPWYAMGMRNQRSINIMVLISQVPFTFDAAGVVTINMKAVATILKSSLSYYIWLRRMSK